MHKWQDTGPTSQAGLCRTRDATVHCHLQHGPVLVLLAPGATRLTAHRPVTPRWQLTVDWTRGAAGLVGVRLVRGRTQSVIDLVAYTENGRCRLVMISSCGFCQHKGHGGPLFPLMNNPLTSSRIFKTLAPSSLLESNHYSASVPSRVGLTTTQKWSLINFLCQQYRQRVRRSHEGYNLLSA